MKIPKLSTFATGALTMTAASSAALAVSSNHTSTGVVNSNTQVAPGNLRGLHERVLKRRVGVGSGTGTTHTNTNTACRASVKERANNNAVYTVVNADASVCPKWIGDVIAECPGLDTLSPSENFENSFSIPDDVLTSTANVILNGYVIAEGNTNSATEDCVAQKFDQIIDEFKDDPMYKVKLGVGVGVGVGAAIAVVGAGVYLYKRTHANPVASDHPVPPSRVI